jgi:hypothetical protein
VGECTNEREITGSTRMGNEHSSHEKGEAAGRAVPAPVPARRATAPPLRRDIAEEGRDVRAAAMRTHGHASRRRLWFGREQRHAASRPCCSRVCTAQWLHLSVVRWCWWRRGDVCAAFPALCRAP